MSKIITVTANTAIDQVIALPPFALGDTILAHSSSSFAAGKGINVAKTLTSLNHPVIALGFVGQQSRSEFEALQSPYFHTDFTFVNGKTRTNITLTTHETAAETHIRTAGYTVSSMDCEHLFSQLQAHVGTGDIVVLSGSLPAGAETDFYNHLITLSHAQGAKVILDSSGEALSTAISAQPDLVKPNQQELEVLVGHTFNDVPTIITAAQHIIRQGVQCVVVSRGDQGVIAVTAKQAISATTSNVLKPIISTVGCGDALVGGLALATLQQQDWTDSLKLATACATANMTTNEPGRFTADSALEAFRQIKLIRL